MKPSYKQLTILLVVLIAIDFAVIAEIIFKTHPNFTELLKNLHHV